MLLSEPGSALAPTRTRQVPVNKSKNTKWSAAEDDLLNRVMENCESPNYQEIAKRFPGKTPQQIAERWEKVLDPSLVKGSWTQAEDEMIISFVRQYGLKNWTKLATFLPGRIGKQCRERWRNHLDPEINREPWTREEDEILIDLHNQYGNQWVKISEFMPGRSDNSVKNRWNSTLKKKCSGSVPYTPKPARTKKIEIIKLPKSADDMPTPPKFEDTFNEMKLVSPSSQFGNDFISPMTFIRSPFPAPSPFPGEKTPGFPVWSPTRGDSIGLFSPRLFSPTESENRHDNFGVLSPLFTK